MELNFQQNGSGKPFIILHGLFGSLDNWKTHAKTLGEYFDMYLIDQRNHGKSPWSDEFSYDLMADDLQEFVLKHNLKDFILLGHSMGGKTAMRYAQKYPELIDKLIIVDMGIKQNVASHKEIIQGLKSIDLSQIHSRQEADEALGKYINSTVLRQFLLKNLHWKERNQLAWYINLPVLADKYEAILEATPKEEVLINTLFINGGLSDYILPEDKPSILEVFPLAEFYTIENAGHWIHADQPEAFIQKVLEYSLGM
ncbi:MAG: alpha/beta fold hydrolase [Brumimicrobium sp.]|nr:alpha/beta fold hydrolase [Brumimicrobium sp.]